MSVVLGFLFGVDPGWWEPVGQAVVHEALPAGGFELSVVLAAEQCEVAR
jgi:hypothetical protein